MVHGFQPPELKDNVMAEKDTNLITTDEKQPTSQADAKEAIADSKTKKEKPKKPSSKFAIFNFLLILMLAGATAYGTYYFWQQQLAQIAKQQSDLASITQKFNSLNQKAETLNQSINTNVNRIQQLDDTQARVTEIAQQAISITNRQQRDWIFAEIDYLIRMANRRLQIGRDINSASAALKAADERLHELGDLTLLELRKQLSADIANLQSLHQVDINGAALAIDQMINHVSDLPFKSLQGEVRVQLEQDKPESDKKDEGFIDSVLSTVMNIGDIKIHDRPLKQASTAEEQTQLEQILRTYLIGARLAVLRYDQQQFAHDLQQAQQILHLHYKTNDNRVAQMKTDLANFGNINLQPELPDITKSWTMLQKIIKQNQSSNNSTASNQEALK